MARATIGQRPQAAALGPPLEASEGRDLRSVPRPRRPPQGRPQRRPSLMHRWQVSSRRGAPDEHSCGEGPGVRRGVRRRSWARSEHGDARPARGRRPGWPAPARLDCEEATHVAALTSSCAGSAVGAGRGGGPDSVRRDDARARATAVEWGGRLRALGQERGAGPPISWLGPALSAELPGLAQSLKQPVCDLELDPAAWQGCAVT